MIPRVVKKSSFFLGIIITGVLGTISNYFGTHYSKENSLFIDHVQADIQPYTWSGYVADGSGGCSGGDSGDCGGGGGDGGGGGG